MTLKLSQNTVQGRLAIGEKHAAKGYPIKLDHFIATHPFDSKTKTCTRHKKMTELFKEKYKTDQPKFVDVVLIDHHPEEAFFTSYMDYKSNLCGCRGNGEICIRNMPDGTKQEMLCNYNTCEFRLTKTAKGIVNTCKPTGIFTFIIPDAPNCGGVWRFTTHSWMTIAKINGSLQKIFQIRKTLAGLKVRLKVVMVSVTVDGKQQNVPTVELEIPFSYNEIANGAGTTIGTLLEMQQRYLSMGEQPNPERIKELTVEAEIIGYDGSAVNDDSSQPSVEIPVNNTPQDISTQKEELNF